MRSAPPATGTTTTLWPTPVSSSRANAIHLPSGEIVGTSPAWVLTFRSLPDGRPVAGESGRTQTCCSRRVSPTFVYASTSFVGDIARSHTAASVTGDAVFVWRSYIQTPPVLTR